MHCGFCGATLPVGAAACPACSTPTHYNVSAPVVDKPDAPAALSSGSMPSGASAPAYPYGTPQQSFSGTNLPVGTPYGTGPNFPTYPGAQPSPYAMPSTPPVQGRPPQGRRSLGFTTILLIVVVLLVMASGVGLIFYSAVLHPAQLHAQATATAQVIATTQAQATALANAQATGTALANSNVTATAQAVATAQVVATATALQNIYNQATSGAPDFSDPMNGSNVGNWEIGNNGQESCSFRRGAFHVVETQKNISLGCLAQNTNYRNFALQAKVTIIKGDEGGIVFRGSIGSSRLYTFGITPQGEFELVVFRGSGPGKPLLVGPGTTIKTQPGQANLLTVVARGSLFYLYINKQYVDSVRDSTFSVGAIGVFAANSKHSTEAAFSNVQVWKL
jgi:hypothetical protein